MEKRSIVLTILIAAIVGVISVAVNFGDRAWLKNVVNPTSDITPTPGPSLIAEPIVPNATETPEVFLAASPAGTIEPSPLPTAPAVAGAQDVQVTAESGGVESAVILAMATILTGISGLLLATLISFQFS